MSHKKGDLYRFKEQLRTEGAPNNYFSLVSHFIDEDDKTEKLILRDAGTPEALVANAEDMQIHVSATFEEKLLACLTDIGESLRILSQGTALELEIEEEEEEPPPEKKPAKKKNVH
jgi:hypothetical protein